MRKINQPEYRFYVIDTIANKITTGWEWQSDAKDQLNEYLEWYKGKKDDLAIVTLRGLRNHDLDADKNEDWSEVQIFTRESKEELESWTKEELITRINELGYEPTALDADISKETLIKFVYKNLKVK